MTFTILHCKVRQRRGLKSWGLWKDGDPKAIGDYHTEQEAKNARAYEALKAAGHSPMKAAEILLDAKRGDKHALQWLQAVNVEV